MKKISPQEDFGANVLKSAKRRTKNTVSNNRIAQYNTPTPQHNISTNGTSSSITNNSSTIYLLTQQNLSDNTETS